MLNDTTPNGYEINNSSAGAGTERQYLEYGRVITSEAGSPRRLKLWPVSPSLLAWSTRIAQRPLERCPSRTHGANLVSASVAK